MIMEKIYHIKVSTPISAMPTPGADDLISSTSKFGEISIVLPANRIFVSVESFWLCRA